MDLLLYVPVTTYCPVFPAGRDAEAGVMEMETNCAALWIAPYAQFVNQRIGMSATAASRGVALDSKRMRDESFLDETGWAD